MIPSQVVARSIVRAMEVFEHNDMFMRLTQGGRREVVNKACASEGDVKLGPVVFAFLNSIGRENTLSWARRILEDSANEEAAS